MKRKYILYAFCLIVFIGWLFASNQIVMWASGALPAEKVAFDEIPAKDVIHCAIGQISAHHNLAETVTISGFAFGDGEQDEAYRTVSLIFKGKTDAYEMRFEDPKDPQQFNLFVIRNDVAQAFPQRGLEKRKVGFIGDFSTISMRDGIYRVYVFCQENEENYGLAATEIWVEKKGDSFSEVVMLSDKAEQLTVTETIPATWHIDTFKRDGDRIKVSGWAFVDGLSCDTQTVYLQITDSTGESVTYKSEYYLKPSVSDVYHGDYDRSGFQAGFQADDLSEGECTLRLLIQNGQEVFGTNKYRFYKSESNVDKINLADDDWRSAELTQLIEMTSTQPIVQWIDGASIVDGALVLNGWAFMENLSSDSQRVYLEFSDSHGQVFQYITRAEERSDVAEAYGDLYLNSGFQARIFASDISNGEWVLRVLVANDEDVMRSVDYQLVRDGDSVEVFPL